jgi:CheY-like chemotaxis protein
LDGIQCHTGRDFQVYVASGMKAAIEILLVDDNAGDTDLTADFLRRSGRIINIHSVLDGVEAMAFLHRQGKYSEMATPHLIMLDLNMPRKNGQAVLLAVKSDNILKQIAVVIFSSSDAQADIKRCNELGANSYVNKPVDLADYKATIATIADYWLGIACMPSL